MQNAAKNKSRSPAGPMALRVLLLLVVALCLGQTRVWGFAVTHQPASGVFESVTPSSTGENYDDCPYDASDSLLAAKGGVPTIGGRVPINSKLAGQSHPSGIQFNQQGFSNFGPVSKAEVQLQGLTGNYAKDAALANQAVGLGKTPSGFVWHDVEDGVTMQLVPQGVRNAARHTGGAAVIRYGGFD